MAHPEWIAAIKQLLEMGVRAEQQALAKWGLNYVIDEYLPKKARQRERLPAIEAVDTLETNSDFARHWFLARSEAQSKGRAHNLLRMTERPLCAKSGQSGMIVWVRSRRIYRPLPT